MRQGEGHGSTKTAGDRRAGFGLYVMQPSVTRPFAAMCEELHGRLQLTQLLHVRQVISRRAGVPTPEPSLASPQILETWSCKAPAVFFLILVRYVRLSFRAS